MDSSSYYTSDGKVENFNQMGAVTQGAAVSYGSYGANGAGGAYAQTGYPPNPAMFGGYPQGGYFDPGAANYNEDARLAMIAEELRQEMGQAQAQGFKHSERMLKAELERIEGNGEPDLLEVDIPKPVKVSKKVLIPSHRHPNFNFVGKLLGPGGKTLQGMAKTFKCHVYVLGKGSTRDRSKEEEQLKSGDPKFAHFGGPLHVRIETEAPIPIAYSRISGLLNELQRLLQPVRDELVASQMEELNQSEAATGEEGEDKEKTGATRGRGTGRGTPRGRGGPPRGGLGGMGARGAPRGRGLPRGRGGAMGGMRGRGASATGPTGYVSYPGFYGSYGGAAATEQTASSNSEGFGGKMATATGGAQRPGPY